MKHIGEIRQILAADMRSGEVTPDNDQIWELSTTRGEPPALALQTTYGLRAYGMRVFPRFTQNKIPFSDPRSFSVHPLVDFSAPNFVSLIYSPISSIDVNQKVWVPNSQTVVGQITLTNTTDKPVLLGMEWVVQLNPMLSGFSMSSAQISINTVLQGQSQHLYPVFFLTGGPQANLSAYPSLGIDMVFLPHTNRQFTWALASLDSTDASFYSARKYSSFSLDNEQVKIQMFQKHQTIGFEFEGTQWEELLKQSQIKTFQLLLPPHNNFNHVSYLVNRLPDQGFSETDKGFESGSGWGTQSTTELWELSHLLLPARPDLLKEILQNFLDQQAGDGAIDTQVSWKRKTTGLSAAPLLASLVVNLYTYLDDKNWLSQIYPALLRSTKTWFDVEHDADQDGFPEWQHLIQTGIAESVQFDADIQKKLDILIQTAEWPSLAAMLCNECECLVNIAKWLNDDTDLGWLHERITELRKRVEDSWDAKRGFCCLRDKTSHSSSKGKIIHVFRQNGSVDLNSALVFPGRIYIQIIPNDTSIRPVVCQIKAVHENHAINLSFTGKAFRWHDGCGLAVSDEILSDLKNITITGLKKGDQAIVGLPDYSMIDPAFMIPLWAGMLKDDHAKATIQKGMEDLRVSSKTLPLFLKIMWIEGLIEYGFKELASSYYQTWFLGVAKAHEETDSESLESKLPQQKDSSNATLYDLLPLTPLLNLLGIQKLTETELILMGFNEFFPKVNVQYKQVTMTIETTKTKIVNLNGESITLEDPGPHKIMLS